MDPLYVYLAYRERVLVLTHVQQKTTTTMERRDQTLRPWSSMFFVGV